MIERGQIWWAELGIPRGSEPGYRRPVLVVQSAAFNESRIGTVVVVAITSNLRLADSPGNARLSIRNSGLPKESVANVSQVATLDRESLVECVGEVSARVMATVDAGLRTVLAL